MIYGATSRDIYRVLPPVRGQHRGSVRRSASRQSDAPARPFDHDFETELERPVCRQVVAGPRNYERRGVSGRRTSQPL